jgi:hypothetical protein
MDGFYRFNGLRVAAKEPDVDTTDLGRRSSTRRRLFFFIALRAAGQRPACRWCFLF